MTTRNVNLLAAEAAAMPDAISLRPAVADALDHCRELANERFADDAHRKRVAEVTLWDDGDFFAKVKHVETDETEIGLAESTYENVNYKESRGTYEYIERTTLSSSEEERAVVAHD